MDSPGFMSQPSISLHVKWTQQGFSHYIVDRNNLNVVMRSTHRGTVKTNLLSMKLQVRSLALLRGLWLCCRPAATAQIGPLAWETLYAMGAVLKRQKDKKKKQKKKHVVLNLKKACILWTSSAMHEILRHYPMRWIICRTWIQKNSLTLHHYDFDVLSLLHEKENKCKLCRANRSHILLFCNFLLGLQINNLPYDQC